MGTGKIMTKIMYELIHNEQLTIDEIKAKMEYSTYDNIRRAFFRLYIDGIVEPHVKVDKKHRKFLIVFSLKKNKQATEWLDTH